MSSERKAMGGFMGFAIRIDILGTGAIYAFNRMRTAAMLALAAINQVVSAVLEYETGMGDLTRIIAINTETTAELNEHMGYLRSTIVDMASDSVYGINQITSAFAYAVRAGKDAAEAVKLVSDAMLLATAVGGDLEEVTRMVNRLGNIWRVAGNPIIDIIDKIVSSESQFAMTTEELMTALNMAGAIAAEAGLSFEQTATMLGFMYDAGINASTAGSTLRRAIKNLVAPSNKSREAIEGLGISYSYLQSLSIDEQFELIAEKLLDVANTNERLNIAFDIFGVRASNIFPVLEGMGDAFDNMVIKIEESRGAAERAAEAYENTLIGKLEKLGNLLNAVAVSIGEFSMDAGGLAVVGTAVGLSMAGLTTAFGYIASGVASNIPLWQVLVKGLTNASSKISIAAGTSNLWTAANSRMNLGFKQGFNYLSKYNKGLSTNLWASIRLTYGQSALAKSLRTLSGLYRKSGRAALWKSIKELFSAGVSGILTAATWALNAALTVMNILLSPISLILMAIGIALIFVIKQMKAGTAVGGFMGGMLDDLKYIFNAIWSVIKAVFKVFKILFLIILAPIFAQIAIAMPFIKIILGVIKVIAIFIERVFGTIMKAIKNLFSSFKKLKWVKDIINWVKDAIKWIVDAVLWVINGVIWLANWLGSNIFGAENWEAIEVVTKEDMLGGKKEPADTGGDGDDDGDYAPSIPSGDTAEVPVGSSRAPSGGRSGGNYNITVYITADMYEMMETERFAEMIGIMIMREISRQKGAGQL